MGWATRRSPVGSAPIRVWAVGKRPAWALVGLEALFPWPGRGEEMGIESGWRNQILLRNPLSPKTFRKGGGEQLRRGFVQPGNATNPSPTQGYLHSLIVLGCWLLMVRNSGISKNANDASHNNTEPSKSLSQIPMQHVAHPCWPNQMKWITVLDKLRLSPTKRHQSLRWTQKRMHSPNHSKARTDHQQSYVNVSRHKQPNAKLTDDEERAEEDRIGTCG